MGGLMLPRSRSSRVLIGLGAAPNAGNRGKGSSSHRLSQTRDTTTAQIWVKVVVFFNHKCPSPRTRFNHPPL